MNLIIVESPSKAKAINEYLKNEKEKYFALSTMGHIRNLVKKAGSIDLEKNFEYKWEFTPQWKKVKTDILENAKKAKKIIIASDLDREGEAICWHLIEVLKKQKINTPTERMIFHSVSKESIKEALKNTTTLRTGLVESYLARIGLDYLFGFSISPLLWHKIPCCKSAGRVQSPALRIIVEKENEIKNFTSKPYIKIHGKFEEIPISSLLIELGDKKFEKGNIFDEEINLDKLKGEYHIFNIKNTQIKQSPPPPFITSTLQQIASSELNFSPNLTMQLAQKLYEGFNINGSHQGLITYMRTDSFNIASEELEKIRNKIKSQFGEKFLSKTIVEHKKKNKNAQEAHEAIRPVDIELSPDDIPFEDENLKKLYKKIWERTLASQCSNAIIESHNISIQGILKNEYQRSMFEIKTNNTLFLGYKLILKEDDEVNQTLPPLKENQVVKLINLETSDHTTQPPKRYSEASLIQEITKKGIGRPSTYSKILSTLYERDYAIKTKKIITPTQKGWIVSSFLKAFFPDEVAYEFTSNLEEKLDELTTNELPHLSIIEEFWRHLDEKIKKTKENSPLEVAHQLETEFPLYFLKNENKCKICGGNMVLKISKFGALRGCSAYPECKNIINIDVTEKKEEKMLGETEDNKKIELKVGPYGPYIQVDNKKIAIPKIWQKEIEDFPIEKAEFLAQLPKILGQYKDSNITLNIGRFGPFVQHEKTFASIKDPMDISFEEAIIKIEEKRNKTTK